MNPQTAKAAIDLMVFFIALSSIAYVLQEPVRGQVTPEPFAARRLVGRRSHREKLRALDIAPLRVRDLVAGSAAARRARRRLAEAARAAAARHPGRALAHRFPPGIFGARDISQMLVGRGELG